MSIHDTGAARCGRKGGRVETSRGKFEDRVYLFAGHVELLHDLVYGGSGFEVLSTMSAALR